MSTNSSGKIWTSLTILLLVIIIVGGVTVWTRLPRSRAVEISLPLSQGLSGGIYIDGAVSNPGFYPLKAGDSLDTLLQSAAPTGSADRARLKLYVPQIAERAPVQKIDLNRAEGWLLEALPEIGSTLAQRIIEYREQKGPFRNINELTMVKGITITTYEKIKNLITVE